MLKLTYLQAIDYVNIESKRLSEAHGMGYYWSTAKACRTVAFRYRLDPVALRKLVMQADVKIYDDHASGIYDGLKLLEFLTVLNTDDASLYSDDPNNIWQKLKSFEI